MWILLWVGKNDRISRDSLKDTEIRFNVPEKEKKNGRHQFVFRNQHKVVPRKLGKKRESVVPSECNLCS